jgi:hypothetical protein
VRGELLLPQTRLRGAGSVLAATLRRLQLEGRSARALQVAHRQLSRQRSLVFLVSDFHLPLAEIDAVLGTLARHDLVPVVLWDPLEFAPVARRGLAHIVDPESGRRQLIAWRPALRERWLAAQQRRREALLQLFRAHRLTPLFIEGEFDADAVTRHFHS